jgi:hypothetical protein
MLMFFLLLFLMRASHSDLRGFAGFRVYGLGFAGFRVWDLQGLGFHVFGLVAVRKKGLQDLGFRV